MKSKEIVIAATLSIVMILTGCFGSNNTQSNANQPTGTWQNTTNYEWIGNGTCCGEKEMVQQQYIVNGNVQDTRWNETGNVRNNNSALPPDTWYPTGNGNIYSREEEYRKYICLGGQCIYSVNETKWISTGAIIMENISTSKEVTMYRGPNETWYFVVDPVVKPVTISFVVHAQGRMNLPMFTSNGMVTAYHSGPVSLPLEYTISMNVSSGKVTVYILDEIGYKQMFP